MALQLHFAINPFSVAITPLCQGKQKKLRIPAEDDHTDVVQCCVEQNFLAVSAVVQIICLHYGWDFYSVQGFICVVRKPAMKDATCSACVCVCVCGCECETRVFVYVEVLSILDGLYCFQQHAQISMFNVPERPSGS